MKHHHRPRWHFQTNSVLGIVLLLEIRVLAHILGVATVLCELAKVTSRHFMRTRECLEAPVHPGSILQSNPEANTTEPRSASDPGIIGVHRVLRARLPVLEDEHALNQHRVDPLQTFKHTHEGPGVGESLEYRVQIVHRVTDLIKSLLLIWHHQLVVLNDALL